METFFALLALCAGNSPVTGEFPTQRPVTRSFDVFFDQLPNKRVSKQWWGWWFETPSCPLWRHCNAYLIWNYMTCAMLVPTGSSVKPFRSEQHGSYFCRRHFQMHCAEWKLLNFALNFTESCSQGFSLPFISHDFFKLLLDVWQATSHYLSLSYDSIMRH